ncbi:unnamed protein product, partial [marine sediment metagenome]
LALVQDALGHSKPETTRIYAKVRNGRLVQAMTRRKQQPEEQLDPETVALAKALQELPEEQRAALANLIRPEAQ